MPTPLGSLRRLLLSPSLAEVTLAERGFPGAGSPAAGQLEAVPHAVICGFEWGIDARDQWELERRLALIEPEQRGFAYEGATMAFTILDAMGPRRKHRTRDLLLGSGQPHIFLTYIGIGFAMSHLPRPLWKKVLPDLSGSPYHPTMSWLAVDGYGFDLAYFHTRRYVDEQRLPAPYPWQGDRDYFLRAVDQGIGRALWFMNGASPEKVAGAVGGFAEHRRADLWAGVGLAATFAGGSSADGLRALRASADGHAAELGQGSVFASKARVYAGYVPEHTGTASVVLAGLSPTDAAALADEAVVDESATAEVPAYELWRRGVIDRLSALAAV